MKMKTIEMLIVTMLFAAGCSPTMDDVRTYGEAQFIADVLSVTNGTPIPQHLNDAFRPLRAEPRLGGAWLVIRKSGRYESGIYVDPTGLSGWGGSGMELERWTEQIGWLKEKQRDGVRTTPRTVP
jgi:hypothetical protein